MNLSLGIATSLAVAVVAQAVANLAPADQYFGPQKISVPGMSARIVSLAERYHMRTIDDTNIVHDAKIVEAALYVWHDKYPKDPDVVKTAFTIEQLYQVVQSTNARTHATTMLRFIAKIAPDSSQAHVARLRLAQGFPSLQTETAVVATPDPYASPSPIPSPSATQSASPSASAAPQASALPTAVPVASQVPSSSPR